MIGTAMKCSECPKEIPADRLRLQPNVKTCSDTCSGKRQRKRANDISRSYRSRVRKALGEIDHIPLFPDRHPEMKVRRGHVVALQQAEDRWQLAVVVRATFAGKATHACSARSWEQQPATSTTRLSSETVAVLPPEFARDHALAQRAEFTDVQFEDLEELRQALVSRPRNIL